MKTVPPLILSAFFALPSFAGGADPAPDTAAKRTIDRVLLTPLAQRDDRISRFSRGRPEPITRAARVVDETARRDTRGEAFFLFSIDARRGYKQMLAKDVMTGCVYPDSGEVYVKRDKAHYPAAFMLGKSKAKAASHVCVDGIIASNYSPARKIEGKQQKGAD